MEFSKKRRRPGRPAEIEPEELLARRSRYRAWCHDFDSVLLRLRSIEAKEERAAEQLTLAEAIEELASAVRELTQSANLAYDGIEDLVRLLEGHWLIPEHEATSTGPGYPEPVYYGGPSPPQYEIWSNGLAADYIKTDGDHNDIPF